MSVAGGSAITLDRVVVPVDQRTYELPRVPLGKRHPLRASPGLRASQAAEQQHARATRMTSLSVSRQLFQLALLQPRVRLFRAGRDRGTRGPAR